MDYCIAGGAWGVIEIDQILNGNEDKKFAE
jgi:hypothetical protein